jgi:hypothetical protein|tara:strand:+ start:231 stop:413 length:183 start_codon:yes stop_codon:yes gene_type:complete
MGYASSKIYGSNQIYFKSWTRKGKTRAELALMVENAKDKKYRNKEYIAFLKAKIKKARKK